MEALVVVLDDDLPVRGHVVGEPPAEAQLAHPVAVEVGDRLVAVPEVLVEGARLGRQADEQEAGVLGDGDRVQRIVGALEELVLVDIGRGQQAPIKVVRP